VFVTILEGVWFEFLAILSMVLQIREYPSTS